MNWLRRLVGKLNRRWIPDSDERAAHDELVRERLRGQTADEEAVVGARGFEPPTS